MNQIGELKNENVLFLQGPMGNFFKKLDHIFQNRGAVTHRIGFNAGDRFFSYANNYTPFKKKPEDWESFIEIFLKEKKIVKIFLFGDCRFYQKVARKVAYKKNIEVFVFEEGYIRPHYVTLEKFGVNGFSTLSRERDFYDSIELKMLKETEHSHTSKTKMVLSSTLYYGISNIFSYQYPHYVHHRDFSALKELYYGVRGLISKMIFKLTERPYENLITNELSQKYFFVPLQTHNDFQILQHSNYKSIEKFIIEILDSFAHHASGEDYLIFKHHPVDRGRKNYMAFIREQATLLGVEKRVLVFHDVYLPSCLKHAKGTVTINSTVGLSAIGHGTATLTMGNAIYNIEGLTNKNRSLKKFWHQSKKPDDELYKKFKQYLLENTQLNGSFYGLFPKVLLDEEK